MGIGNAISRRDFVKLSALSAALPISSSLSMQAIPESELAYLSLLEISRLIATKKVSPVEVTRHLLARIDRTHSTLNAFITVTADLALAQARNAEREIAAGRKRGLLHGVPVALKDLVDTAGVRTTAASRLFETRVPTSDAEVVRRLYEAGAVMLGKLNLDEFAGGGTSTTGAFGPVHNPWDLARSAGGSSGGSGAAVAAGLCYAALGTDTGASIRIPAAVCGVVGLKPTYGRVSTRGVIPAAWSRDHVGPLARGVEDAAAVLDVIAGYDSRDATSANVPVGAYLRAAMRRAGAVKFGVAESLFDQTTIEPEVRTIWTRALTVLKELGPSRPVDLPEPGNLVAIMRAEGFAYHRNFIEQSPEKYGAATLTQLKRGADTSAADYIAARRQMEEFRRSTPAFFDGFEVLVAPAYPVAALRLDSPSILRDWQPLAASVNMSFFSTSGIPTVSVPVGFTREGLPIGLQLATAPWEEEHLLSVAAAFERATSWHERHPRI